MTIFSKITKLVLVVFSKTKSLALVVFFILSLVLNVATLASSTVAIAMSGIFKTMTGINSVVGEVYVRRKIVAKITKRIIRRTVAAVARNAGSVLAESVPYIGAAVVVGVTAMDLHDACETMKEMQELNEAFGLEPSNNEHRTKVCGTEIP